MIELWPHQSRGIGLLRDSFRSGNRRTALVSPTGSGKTITFCALAEMNVQRRAQALVLVHRKELLDQTRATLSRDFGMTTDTIVASKWELDSSAQVFVGMVETAYRRLQGNRTLLSDCMPDLQLVIVDEAHERTFVKTMEQLHIQNQNLFYVGPTATPKFSQGKMSDAWDDMVELATIKELIGDGYLVNDRTFSFDVDFSELKTANGEFTEESQIETLGNKKMAGNLIKHWENIARGRKTICYNVNVEHSKATNDLFNAHGIKSAHVDGETPADERAYIFHMFEQNKIHVLNNVGICTTGYDEPPVSCIIQNFCTKSLPKYIQTAGRGARICDHEVIYGKPTYEGKSEFFLLDMGGNYARHGLFSDNIDWYTYFNGGADKERALNAERTWKLCPHCHSAIPREDLECPECEHSLTKESTDIKLTNKEIKEIKEFKKKSMPIHLKIMPDGKKNLDQLCQKAAYMDYKPGWVIGFLKRRGVVVTDETYDKIIFKINKYRKERNGG